MDLRRGRAGVRRLRCDSRILASARSAGERLRSANVSRRAGDGRISARRKGQPRASADSGRRLLGRTDVPRDRELPDFRRAGAPGDGPGLRPHQEGRCAGQRRARRPGRGQGARDRSGLRRDPGGKARGPVRRGRLPGGRGHVVPHERQRGRRRPRLRDPRQAARRPVGGQPQRRRQPRPVDERHVSDGAPPRGDCRGAASRGRGGAARVRVRPERAPSSPGSSNPAERT